MQRRRPVLEEEREDRALGPDVLIVTGDHAHTSQIVEVGPEGLIQPQSRGQITFADNPGGLGRPSLHADHWERILADRAPVLESIVKRPPCLTP